MSHSPGARSDTPSSAQYYAILRAVKFLWSGWLDLNQRPPRPERGGHSKLSHSPMGPSAGIEPAASALQKRRAAISASTAWTAHGESNSVPQHGKLVCYRNTLGGMVAEVGAAPTTSAL